MSGPEWVDAYRNRRDRAMGMTVWAGGENTAREICDLIANLRVDYQCGLQRDPWKVLDAIEDLARKDRSLIEMWPKHDKPTSYNNDHKKSVTFTDMIWVGGKPMWVVSVGQAYERPDEALVAFRKALKEAYKGHPPLGE